MPGKRAKRFLRFVLWVLITVIVLAVSIPLWFPWLLRPAAKRFGATFQRYERSGYSQFVVTDVAYTNRNVHVRAKRLELAPWRRHGKAEDWSVIVEESTRRSTNSPASVHRIYQNVSKIVSNVQHWVPQAALTNGYVQTPAVTIQLPGINWIDANLSGQVQFSNALPLTTVEAKIPLVGPVHIELKNPLLEIESTLIASNTSTGVFINATNRWRTNDFFATARFGTQGRLPETATLTAKSVAVAPFAGDVSFAWQTNQYVFDVQGVAELKQPLTFRAQVIGDMTSHRGAMVVPGISVPHVWPFDVALDWSGKKFDLEQVHANVIAGRSAIAVSGAGDLKEKRFQITGLALGTNEIDFAADLRWPGAADLCVQMTNLSVELVHGFLDLPYDQVILDHLRLAAAWGNGPVQGDLDFAGRTVLKDGTQLGAVGAAATHAKGITITNLTFTRNGDPVSAAHGWIPASINPTNRPIFQPVADEPLQLQATAHEKAFFWKLIEEKLGITMREPDARAYLSGTWTKPRGRLSLRASEVKFRHAKPEWPPLENLSLVAHVHKEATEIEFLNFFAANQPVTFLGEMPLPEGFWRAPRTNAANLDWRNMSCRLQIDSAQIAAFVPLLPGLIAPQGTVNADLGLARGGKLKGQLRIDGAGTRPIAALGALQDIEILCRFADDKAQVNSYTALGGYSVFGGGEVQVDINQLLRRELPVFEFHLSGENVPLTRQADAVIRADLDATVRHAPPQPVMISGKLNLRDSLYLRELRDLVPGRLASPDRRPPYFSVEAHPFADWRLDLNAAGHRFLKVRTPIFNGEVSADFRIFGTLRDPVAVGDLTINSGLVRFPFGNIPVNQGLISLTSDNPYRPQLLINGNDRVLGYDINMELSGFADAPLLQFSSTPPLSSEQILLMLTAGEIPRQGQFSFTAQERAQKFAVFLGRGLLSDFGIGGNSNRLTIRSGEHISESGRPTYSVEYELTEDWSVIGQYDQFNDFNLMLKWRVYSK